MKYETRINEKHKKYKNDIKNKNSEIIGTKLKTKKQC